jgi:hypothetical protein
MSRDLISNHTPPLTVLSLPHFLCVQLEQFVDRFNQPTPQCVAMLEYFSCRCVVVLCRMYTCGVGVCMCMCVRVCM